VHNCTSAVLGVTLAEVFTMGIKAGIEPLDLWEAVRQGATGRQRTFDRLGRFLSGKHDPADFALRLLHKNVALGREVGVPMRLANMAFEELTEAMNRGWGTRNSSVGQLLQVERSGIPPLAADPERIAAVLDADKQGYAASGEAPFTPTAVLRRCLSPIAGLSRHDRARGRWRRALIPAAQAQRQAPGRAPGHGP
jgi:hypothetical protein